MQDLGQAMQLNPQDAQVRCHRGLVRTEVGDYQGAIEDFSQLLQDNPENIEAYTYRGHAYGKQKNYRQAIEDYSRALSLQPNNAQLYCHRAVARVGFEDRQGAIEDYQKAANLYFDKQDWDNYRQVLDKLKTIQSSQSRSTGQKRSTQSNFGDRFHQNTRPGSNSQPSPELQSHLLGLVGGNWDIAKRLLEIAKQREPGMPEEWYWKQVIKDLERDR